MQYSNNTQYVYGKELSDMKHANERESSRYRETLNCKCFFKNECYKMDSVDILCKIALDCDFFCDWKRLLLI